MTREYFADFFGKRREPLDAVFRRANQIDRNSKLSPVELAQFRAAAGQVKNVDDLEILNRLLYRFEKARRKSTEEGEGG